MLRFTSLAVTLVIVNLKQVSQAFFPRSTKSAMKANYNKCNKFFRKPEERGVEIVVATIKRL